MRKIFALVLPLTLLTLMAIPAGNALIKPVEVERVKDVCFIRIRGDYHTQSFLFHYVNLSPDTQWVVITGRIEGYILIYGSYTVLSGGSIDETFPGDYGYTMEFEIYVDTELVLEGSVVIPSPP